MGAIFISYRRSDSQAEAGRLFHELAREFGQGAVFMDVVAIEAGRDFRKVIEDSVQSCDGLLAMIGPEWLAAADEQGSRRLDFGNDYVRIEIGAALGRDIPVIPVLLRGAKMPRFEQLPEAIADLAYRNAVELTHVRWKSDVQLLLNALRPLLSDTAPAPTRLNPAVAQRVARELAAYIGPIAELVVKRAAPRCHSPEELYRHVSAEIELPADREKFLAAIRG